MSSPTHQPDAWFALRQHTPARIALGRAGGSLPTSQVLDFNLAHAEARDAVHCALDVEKLVKDLAPLGAACLTLATQAGDRQTYLQRPDLGRRLDPTSHDMLSSRAPANTDVALIIGDGLSSPAAQHQAPAVLHELLPLLRDSALSLAPLCIVRHARVAVEDEVGSLLGAKAAVILIGERPGLGTSQSLGAYLVYDPRLGRTDAQRNCISNIRPSGLTPAAGAQTLHYLILQSLQRKLSGIALKDDRPKEIAFAPR